MAAYKRRLRLIILTMFNKNDIRIGGEGRIVEIDESLFIKVKHNRGRDILRPKVWVFMKEPTNLKECYFLRWILEMQLHYWILFLITFFLARPLFSLIVGLLIIELLISIDNTTIAMSIILWLLSLLTVLILIVLSRRGELLNDRF